MMKRYRDYSDDDIHFIFSQLPPEEVNPFINFVKKVRARFQHDQPEKFRSFFRIVEDAMISEAAHDGEGVGRLTDAPQDFHSRIEAIFGGSNDLIDGYNSIMQPCHRISLDDREKKETVESRRSGFPDVVDFLNKLGIECGEDGYEELLENSNLFKKGARDLVDVYDLCFALTEGHPDLQEDFLKFMPLFEANPLACHLPDLLSADLDNSGVVEREKSSPENVEAGEKEFVRADESEENGCSLDEEEETVANTESETIGFREAMDFVNKLRIQCGQDDYEEFLKISRLNKEGSRNWVDVCGSDLRLTEGHSDLREEFLKFIPITEAKALANRLPDLQSSDIINGRVDKQQKISPENREVCPKTDRKRKFVKTKEFEVRNSISEQIRQGVGFFEKVEKNLACKVSYKKFLKLFLAYSQEKIEKEEFKDMVSSLIGNYPDLMREFRQFWKKCESISVSEVRGCIEKDRRERKDRKRERRRNKSIEKLDQTRSDSQVVNDEIISVSSRPRGNSCKHKGINQYENLFECEDEQFELDMLLEWLKSAHIYAEELGGVTIKNKEKNGSRIIFEQCIERLYSDQGLEVLEMFNRDPQRTLPVLRMRLQQKIAELIEYRDSLKGTWLGVYARNYQSPGLPQC